MAIGSWVRPGLATVVASLSIAASAQGLSHWPDGGFRDSFDGVSGAITNDNDAARFLAQATFGPSPNDIAHLRSVGYAGWLNEQFAAPASTQTHYLDWFLVTYPDDYLSDDTRLEVWAINSVGTPDPSRGNAVSNDQLRQRIAFALSEIFVVSNSNGTLAYEPWALSSFYDMLAADAFGNYRTLLEDVSKHPAMGIFLSSIQNQKADPTQNIHPDENYAREVMQLFSIGLIQRNLDFSPVLDGEGQPIATYDQSMVQSYAKVFTGWSYTSGFNSNPVGGNWSPADYEPLVCYEIYHDESEKVLLDNEIAPGGADSCEPDLDAGLAAIEHHANVAPFVSRQLIERFTSSNPSPDYIERVASVFVDDGHGVYGNLGAVVVAVLTDPEARYGAAPPPAPYVFGKAREPLLKLTALWRYYGAAAADGLYSLPNPQKNYAERPLGAPSVFNFYLPDYLPPGELADAGLFGPEFQIMNESTVVSTANDLTLRTNNYVGNPTNDDTTVAIDLAPLVALASTPSSLVAALDHDLMYGGMSDAMASTLTDMIAALPANNPTGRATGALQVLLASPEFAIQK